MTRSIRIAFIALCAALLASCAAYEHVKPDKKVAINGSLTLDPQIDWNRLANGKTESWTIDGNGLQEMRIYAGLKDGDVLFPSVGPVEDPEKDKKKPKFGAKMTPIEIMEFFDASVSQLGAANVEVSNLRPERLGGQSGFRFDFTFASDSGLRYQGFAVGTVKDEKLYMILFKATELYFFPRNKDDVERLIRSVCFGTEQRDQPAGSTCT